MRDVLERLPTLNEVSQEIADTAQRARRLRSLYRVLRRMEEDRRRASESARRVTTAQDRQEVTQ